MRTNGRAWSGKLKNIDELMAWMYDNDILNKGEKDKKDSIFRQYYRYYNDGDAPRGVLRKYGVSMYQSSLVEEKLEEYLSDFISAMLKKYCPKIDRQDFYIDRRISRLNIVLGRAKEFDADGIQYWVKKTNNKMLKTEAEKIASIYSRVRGEFNCQNEDMSSYVLSYAMKSKDAVLTDKFKSGYRELQEAIIDFMVLVKNEIALEEAKKIRKGLK
jgi:hypothetical protein